MFPVTEFVKFMNGEAIPAGKSRWDSLSKKPAHDADGNEIAGKYFLSTDTRQNVQNVEIVLGTDEAGEPAKMLTTRLEIPVIIARNIQSPEFKLQRKAAAQAGRVLTQASKLNPDDMTDDQKAEARALLARLSA